MTATRYEVQTLIGFNWENCWREDDGTPTTFETFEEAEQEMKDHVIDCINAVEGGDMDDSPDPSHLRVIRVAN